MKRAFSSPCAALAGCVALMLSGIAARAVTLSTNLTQPIDGVERITNTRWLGSQFKTDGQGYLLDAVTLRLQRNINGAVEAAIFTDDHGRPGKLVGMLNSSGAITGTPRDVTFRSSDGGTTNFTATANGTQTNMTINLPGGVKISNANPFAGSGVGGVQVSGQRPGGLPLAADSTYWVVTRATSGQFASAYTDSENGTGVGFSPTWAHSENGGASWSPESLSPLFLGVDANTFAPVFLQFRIDYEAIASAIGSALPTALVQREALFGTVRDVTRDVNARLFRQRVRSRSLDREERHGVASRFEYFTTGEYSTNDQESRFPASGFGSDVFAATTGLEFHVTPELTLGAAFTYVESDNDLGLGIGDLKITGEAFTTYIAFSKWGFYADALYSFGTFQHEIRRDTLFGKTALAKPDSRTHTIELNLGYNMDAGRFVTGPFTTLTYITGDLDGYTETGGGTANVRVGGQNFDSLVSRVGWQVSRPFEFRGVEFTPQFRAAWTHEFLDESETVGVGLTQSPFEIGSGNRFTRVGSFNASTKTKAPGADALEIGLGVVVQISANFGLVVDYSARLWQADNFGQSVSLTGNFKF